MISRFGVQDLRLRIEGAQFRVQGLRISGSGTYKDIQGQIVALAFRLKSSKPSKLFPGRSAAERTPEKEEEALEARPGDRSEAESARFVLCFPNSFRSFRSCSLR